jgi:hypothetical protein
MNPTELQSHAKTREVKINPNVIREHPRWIPKPSVAPSNVPSTPSSSTVQTIFGQNVGPGGPYTPLSISDPGDLWGNTPKFAKEMLSTSFVGWYWGMYLLWKLIGLDFAPALFLALICLATICLGTGFYKSWRLTQTTYKPQNPGVGNQIASQPTVARQVSGIKPTPQSITTDDPIIGNRSLHIYHLSECVWVSHILDKNKTPFMSQHDAVLAGYKACRVCLPSA